jgi:predicted transcriptional regulator of viral defense system
MASIGRTKLAAVINAAGAVVHVTDAAASLGVSRTEAAKTLARWAKQGWLQRVGTGAYVPVRLEMTGSGQVVEDAWVLVPTLFGPAYIGGRSAAEYWDLTEQIFRDIVVFTARPLRARVRKTGGAEFTLRHIPEERIFGTKAVWRGQTKVLISDIDRTMVDMLDDPSVGGGIQHVGDCLDRYLRNGETSTEQLIAYADRIGNGAVFKRLGFLAERHPLGERLIAACRERLTKGLAKLDPALDGSRLIKKWNLRIPDTWIAGGKHDRQG